MGAFIAFQDVTKNFGAVTVVDRLDLQIAKGEFLSLLGPSGSGKTTILMMLAGFERPTSGAILLADKPITHLPPHRRQMGVVFQNYALFPHMTVAENVAFPLEMQRVPRAEITRRVERALDMVRLSPLKDRKPSQLSGGQQQRVALTRALVFEPDVILMDEPLGALDKQLREHMQLEIRDLHRRLGLTIVFVTHDQSEALTMSDRIAVFNAGKVEQIDTPQAVYDRPRTRFVAEFIGETNLVEGKVVEAGAQQAVVRVGETALNVSGEVSPGRDVSLSLRPERIRLGKEPAAANALPVTVADCIYHGDHMRLVLKSGTIELVARAERLAGDWAVGTEAVASFDPQDCTVLAS